MDVLAHSLWAGAGLAIGARYRPISRPVVGLTVAMTVMPDIPHLLPSLVWWLFGEGSVSQLLGYAVALPGQEPIVPPWVDSLSHHLHCVTHSVIIAAAITLLLCVWLRKLWVPLLGWWLHIFIDVFTHSSEYYPVTILYPFSEWAFDGIAWITPWFIAVNYLALISTYAWLILRHRAARRQATAPLRG